MFTQDFFKLIRIYLGTFSITFSIFCFVIWYYNKYLLFYSIVLFTIILVSQIFVFSFRYNNTRFIDPYWGFNGIFILMLTLAHLDFHVFYYNNNFNEKVIVFSIFSLIFIYGARHLLIYGRSFQSLALEHEDFRYVGLRAKFENKKLLYWIFNYLFLHLYPILLEACLIYPSIQVIEIFNGFEKEKGSKKRSMFGFCYLGYFISIIGFFIETIADEQLYFFIKGKEHKEHGDTTEKANIDNSSKDQYVMKQGFWKNNRHPNYLGEIIFYFGILVINYGVTQEISFYRIVPFIAFFLMFVFYSIPEMEQRLLTKYRAEYSQYKQTSYRLIPYIY